MEDLRPKYLLLVGIAGGFKDRDNTQLGDVVVPDFVDGYEMRKIVRGGNRRRMEAYDHPSHRLRYQIAQNALNGTAWLARIKPERRPVDDGISPRAFCGNLISGEKILGDDEDAYQRLVLSEFDNAIAVDMESLGVATAVYEMRGTRHYSPEYLIIRGISDLVNEPGNNQTRQRWRGYAAHTAAAFAAEVIERLLRLG